MSKRKYSEITGRASSQSGLSGSKRTRVEGLLEYHKKSLFRSLKVARGFERQKLGRRQKTATAEHAETEIKRLEAEVAALKSLELATMAELHLYKALLKSKPIASNPAFPQHVQATVDAAQKPQSTASANVQARLFNSGPVKATMTEALSSISAVLGIEAVKKSGKQRLRAKDFTGNDAVDGNGVVPSISREQVSLSDGPAEKEWEGFSDPERGYHNDLPDISGDESDEYDVYASRLVKCSDEDSTDDSSKEDKNWLVKSNAKTQICKTRSEKLPTADDLPPGENAPRRRAAAVKPKSTTFLPSLSLGGYWSGSEAASDDDEGLAGQLQVRKNRRGQQARRAIAEKKFGKNAKHLRNQSANRDEGWDARKGASGGDDRGKKGRGRGREEATAKAGRGPMSSGANSDPVRARKARPAKPAADGPLHPSWEAARKAKEQKTAVAFQGKKVVFD